MESVTLAIALIASALVFLLPSVYGLIVYVAAFTCYPSYLSVQIGTLDFTVRRMVIIAIFLRIFLLTYQPKKFKFIWLDGLIIFYYLATFVAGSITTESMSMFLENRAGQIFDTVLPYFAVRMIVQKKEQYISFLKGLMIIAAPLAIVGFYQCMTGENPVGFLKQYAAWVTTMDVPWSRHGFFRADVTFEHFIMYGLFFAMYGPACAGLLRIENKKRLRYWIGLGFMGLGIFSSMSSGPILVALLAGMFIIMYRQRKYWKVVTGTVFLMCLIVEIISNRHFYDVLGGFTLSASSAWYRSRLIDVAIFEGGMSGHWLLGYGWGVDPGWHASIDFRNHTDLGSNQYIAILSGYGLVGLIPFITMNIGIAKSLIGAFKASIVNSEKWLIWCLGSAFLGLAGGFMTVSIFGQPTTIYYMMIAFAGLMPSLITRQVKTIQQNYVIDVDNQHYLLQYQSIRS